MRSLIAVGITLGLAVVGTGGATAAAHPTTTTTSPTAGAWRQTDGSASGNNANLGETSLTSATVGHLLRLRTVRDVKPESCGSFASPLLSASHLFDIAGGAINQYDLSSGRLTRRFDLAGGGDLSNFGLALNGGVIVIAGSDCVSASDPPGLVSAYDSTTTKHLWTWGDGTAVTSMAESAGYVVVTTEEYASSGVVTVLDATSGDTAWSLRDPSCELDGGRVVGGNVIITRCAPFGTTLEALNLRTGHQLWSRSGNWTSFRGDSATAPAAQLYAQNPNGHVVALDSQTGKRIYRMSSAHDVLAADGRRVYATCGSTKAHLCAFDATSGAKVWRADLLPPPESYYTPAAIVGGDVLYLRDGQVLSTATGQRITRLWSTWRSVPFAVGRGRLAAAKSTGIALYGLPSAG